MIAVQYPLSVVQRDMNLSDLVLDISSATAASLLKSPIPRERVLPAKQLVLAPVASSSEESNVGSGSGSPKRSPTPLVRSAPSGLWHIVRHKSHDSATMIPNTPQLSHSSLPTPSPASPPATCSPVQAFPQPQYLSRDEPKEPMEEDKPAPLAPIGSERFERRKAMRVAENRVGERWKTDAEDPMDVDKEEGPADLILLNPRTAPSSPRQCSCCPPGSTSYSLPSPVVIQKHFEQLTDIHRKNRHAPHMPSRFNPLRDDMPPLLWTALSDGRKTRKLKTPWLPTMRSRNFCDNSFYNLRPCQYLAGDFRHCPECTKDSLRKRLLVYIHHRSRNPHIFRSEDSDDDDDDSLLDLDDDDVVMDIAGDGIEFASNDHCPRSIQHQIGNGSEREYHYGCGDWEEGPTMVKCTPDSPLLQDLDDFEF